MEDLAADLLRNGASVLGLRYFNVYGPGKRTRATSRPWFDSSHCSSASATRSACSRTAVSVATSSISMTSYARRCSPWRARSTGSSTSGAGSEHSFAELAATVVHALGRGAYQCEFVPPPPDYQARTLADTSRAVAALGFDARESFADGVSTYASAVAAGGCR